MAKKLDFEILARINSLNGGVDKVKVVEQTGDNDYIVEYKGKRCRALFNWFVEQFYVDDVYGILGEVSNG